MSRRPAAAGLAGLFGLCRLAVFLVVIGCTPRMLAAAQPEKASLPELTEPVNDFAHVIDPANAAALDRMIRTLMAATNDVVVVATVQTIEPFGTTREYANKLFENHGRGIGFLDRGGGKGQDNGLLIVLSIAQRRVEIEVGYDLEQWITDGFSGETSREYMAPAFREGRYGDGLRIGTERIIARIAQGRGVTLEGVQPVRDSRRQSPDSLPFSVVFIAFIILLALSRIGGGRRGVRTWGRGGWSGWSSGVGPFGGGWGGGGGGFGGGFGGFGGGRSGGGGGGASW
jgi:uncharacterized protein